MKKLLTYTGIAVILAATATLSVRAIESEEADDDEKEGTVAVESLPAPVKSAIEAAAPAAQILAISQEKEDGTVVYEIELKTTAGTEMEIEVSADGSLLELEEELGAEQLPAAVARTLADIFPTGQILEAEKTMNVVYEVEKKVNGTTYEITLDANGRILSVGGDD